MSLTPPKTIQSLIFDICQRLDQHGVDGAERDAQLIVGELLSVGKAELIARSREAVTTELEKNAWAMAEKRLTGMPIGRVVGHRLGWKLNQDTLEPRDDTEALIELVIEQISNSSEALRFADLGTGTGFIGISLLQRLPASSAVLTDVSNGALEMAKINGAAFEQRLQWMQGSWASPLEGLFDFIVSNPPYIRRDAIEELDGSVRHYDPIIALDGGVDGLDAYRELLSTCAAYLVPSGFLALEIGYDQKDVVEALALQNGWRLKAAAKDMQGHDRALVFVR